MNTWSGIEYFVLVVRRGSFASAAKALGVSPSAVSRKVANLEKELGTKLLSRNTRNIALTEDGKAFLAYCHDMLKGYASIKDVLSSRQSTPSGSLKVDVPVSLGQMVIAPKLAAFIHQYPDIQVQISFRDTFVDPISEGLDIVLRLSKMEDSSYFAKRFKDRKMVLCASPTYLQKNTIPACIKDLSNHKRLGFLSQGSPQDWVFEEDGKIHRVPPSSHFITTDAQTLCDMACKNQGLVYIMDFIAEKAIDDGKLVALNNFTSKHAHRPLYAIYHTQRHLRPNVRVFLDFLSSFL